MAELGNIMVFLEMHEGKIEPIGFELISKAALLAERLGCEVTAVAVGWGLAGELESCGAYGCSRVYYMEDERVKHFTALPYIKALTAIIKKHAPRIVLFGATTTGRAVAPGVASALRCGLTADCTALEIGSYKDGGRLYDKQLLQIRPAFGGNIIATIVSPESSPSMATVREGVMALRVADSTQKASIIKEDSPLNDSDILTEVLEVVHSAARVNLKGANIVVSAGIGAAPPASLELVRELAHTLGGVLGASRAIVESGILPKAHQVGQTGTTVRPNLYIACGISGQIQHRAGMSEAKRIVAINIDREAPIFKIAHYSIVADLNDVIPMLIKSYKKSL